jgi:hypothetical protein
VSKPAFLFSTRPHVNDTKPNIVVPYANAESESFVHKAMKLNLLMQGLKPRMERLDDTLDADFAYARLFRSLWQEERPFVLVEHDILPWPGALQQIWECEHPWCGFRYYIFGELRSALGCVKFDPVRLGECPLPDELIPWSKIDMKVIRSLSERGERGHLHEPAVGHLNYGHQRITAPEGIIQPTWINE